MLIQHLTQNVKHFSGPFQWQDFRVYHCGALSGHKYLILWEIFSREQGAARILLFSSAPKDSQETSSALGFEVLSSRPQSPWQLKVHPLSLFIKSHLVNKVVSKAEVQKDVLVFEFSEGSILRVREITEGLEFEVSVPGKKAFSKQILLDCFEGLASENKNSEIRQLSQENLAAPLNKKKARLIANVQNDFEEAKNFLESWSPLFEKLEMDPSLWGNKNALSPKELDFLNVEIQNKNIPRFESSLRAEALEKIFRLRRRMNRKLESASLRLKQVKKEALKPSPLQGKHSNSSRIKIAKSIRHEKELGLRLPIFEGLELWVGRSAQENDDLFRRFRDRDLWFHVRGYAGSHVWMPRGQKLFPKKAEASEKIIDIAAQVAVLNSKLKDAGEGEVDIAERRFLKKGSSPGEVLVLKSKVRRVKVKDDLKTLLFPKKI